ncbi:MAG: hypothetical protein AAGJ52_06355 [Pseudomonadota bacterium]
MKSTRTHYSLVGRAGQWLLCLIVLAALQGGLLAAELRLDSGPGRAGPISWTSASLQYSGASAEASGWSSTLSDVRLALGANSEMALQRVLIECPGRSTPAGGLPACESGRLSWTMPGGDRFEAALVLIRQDSDLVFDLTHEALQLEGVWRLSDARLGGLRLQVDELDLSLLQAVLSPWIELDYLAGRISGSATLDDRSLSGSWQVERFGFDGDQGQVAGDSVALTVQTQGQLDDDQQRLRLDLIQTGGELLFGPLYLPTPGSPINLVLELSRRPGELSIDGLRYEHPDVVTLQAEGQIALEDSLWSLTEARLTGLEADLSRAWPRWVEGLAAGVGFADLGAQGQVSASGFWRGGVIENLETRFEDFSLRDPQQRIAVQSAFGGLELTAETGRLALDLSAMELYGLPFGATRFRAVQSDRLGGSGWELSETARLPLLDGAVLIERLNLQPGGEDQALFMDASIEPLSLESLTQVLGWPQFGGQLAGRFPGIELRGDRLDFSGGITVDAFSGQVRMSELVVERPFGTLPALATQVEIERLDLLELTGAFNFGRMEGQLSGEMRDLRLLDWRPVAMDTRLYTHEDAPSRRISQRAVNNLSNLGGSLGGALINNTVLSVFDDFPYRRAGLSCRLSNNICYVGGVAEHSSGGFYIVEGRLLPRLDIIGHRRLVDWPQLIAQLVAATR